MTSSSKTFCFTLKVEDDDVVEETEDLILQLRVVGSTTDSQVVIEPSQLIVTITDNDQGISMSNILTSR